LEVLASHPLIFEPAMVLKIRSPAKINLVLEVLGERADGYHEVRTVMQSIDLCDEILIEEHPLAGHLELHTNTMSCPVDEKNLVWQAIHWLREATGFNKGLVITIDKNIPVSAGFGGGSSNAGTVLAALVAKYGLNVGHNVLHQIAGRVGSDVSFFLIGGTALATGRGEIVADAPQLPKTSFVLASPGIPVETGRVYRGLRLTGASRARAPKDACSSFLAQIARPECWEMMANDLEATARRLYPSINDVFEVLSALGVKHAMVSGSGGAVFAPVESPEAAKQLALRLSTAGFWSQACESMDRAEFKRGVFSGVAGAYGEH